MAIRCFVHQIAWLDKNLSCPTYLQIPDIFGLFFSASFLSIPRTFMGASVTFFLTLFYADEG